MNKLNRKNNLPNILAIDATTESSSVALYYNYKYFSKYNADCNKKISTMFPMIKKILKQANITLEELNLLVYCNGPGSYTGIKFTTCIAYGLTFGLNIPIISISSLMVMAQEAYNKLGIKNILVAIDAKMGEIYCAFYTLNSHNFWIGEKTESIFKPKEYINYINNKLTNMCWATAGNGWNILFTSSLYKKIKLTLYHSNINSINAISMLSLILTKWKNNNFSEVNKKHKIYQNI